MYNPLKNVLIHCFYNRIFRNIGYLAIGNITAQIISLIGALYIPKLLGPQQYGTYNIVTAYVALFTVFTFDGLNKVIIRQIACNLTKAKEILEATIGLRNLFSIFATFLSIFILVFIDYDKGTKIYIAIFSFSLFLSGIQSSLNTMYQAFEQMKILAVFSIASQVVRVPLAILFLKNGYGIISLIILQLSIQLILFISNYYYSKNIVVFNYFTKIKLIKFYIKSGINFTLLEILGIISCRIDLVMLSFLTTPQNVGIYALSYNIVNKGLIIRNPISQSLFPYYSKKYKQNKPEILNLFKHSINIFILLLLLFFPVLLFGESLIVKVVGLDFVKSAKVLNVLIFYLVFNFSIIPWGLAIQTTNNEIYSLITGFTCAIINVVLNFLFFNNCGIIGIAYSTLVVEFTRTLISVIIVYKVVTK